MYNLGSIEYTLDVNTKEGTKKLDKFDKTIQKGTKSTQQFGSTASKAGSMFKGLFATAVVAGALKIGKHLVRMSSQAQEVGNKFDVTFKGVQSSADKTARDLAKNYGLSRKASKKLLADTGDLLTGFGFTADSALDLSGTVNRLAVDLGSFQNLETEDVSKRITTALTGETESLKSLGVVIKQGSKEFKNLVTATAEAQGITETQAKSLVILDEIQKQSKNSLGDFARSQSSFANQTKVAKANIDDLSVAFGDILLPVASVGVSLFNDFSSELTDTGEAIGAFLGKAENAKKIGDAIGFIAGYLVSIKNLGTSYLSDIVEAFKLFIGPIFQLGGELNVMNVALKVGNVWLKVLGGILKIVGRYLGGVVNAYIQFGKSIINVVKSLKNFQTVWEGIQERDPKKVAEGFKAMGKVSFDEIVNSLGSVKDTFVDTGKQAIKEWENVRNAWSDGDALVGEFKKAKDKASKITTDGLVKEQEAYEDAVKNRVKAKENETDQVGASEEEQTLKAIDEMKKREEELKSSLGRMASYTETYAGTALSIAGSIAQVEDNNIQTRLNNEKRALEENKQTWDLEAEAKKASLDQETMNEEEYQSAITAIDEANKAKQIDAEYRYQQASYEAEVDGFRRKQALAYAEIAINAGIGIMRAFSENWWPVALGISAGITAQGIAQAAVVASQPPPVAPVKPAFAEGGIVHNPGPGVEAIVGEGRVPEAIIPLNNDTLSTLGNAISEAQSASTSRPSGLVGQLMKVIIPGIGEKVVEITQNALYNRELNIPAETFV